VSNVNVGGGGWTGNVSWVMSGDQTTVVNQTTFHYTASGSGMVRFKPGMEAYLTYESATASYNYQMKEVYDATLPEGQCTYHVVQQRDVSISGTSTSTTG
jgi:hypothetical protein